MNHERLAKGQFIAITATTITFLFVYYTIGATRLLNFFPSIVRDVPPLNVERGLDSLLIWAGVSVSIMAACCIMIVYALYRFCELSGWVRRYSLFWVGALVVIAASVLFSGGNRIAEMAIVPHCDIDEAAQSICDISGAAANRAKNLEKVGWQFFRDHGDQASYAVAIVRIKYTLNLLVQTAGIALLSLMIILSAARRIFSLIEEKRIRETYLISSLLLTLVILSDALFYEFLVDAVGGNESGYIEMQRGLLFYFAIVSTATLALALSACSIVGKVPLMLSSTAKGEVTDPVMVDRAKAFFLNPGFATAFATFAPLLTAVFSSEVLG